MTESAVLRDLYERARRRQARIVLPEVGDPRTVQARRLIEEREIGAVEWVESPTADKRLDEVALHVYHRRKHKGVDEAKALELASDPLWFAASLIAMGQADAGVAGAYHTTSAVIRAGLGCIGTAADSPLISSFFLMVRGDQALSFADCGVVPDPDAVELCAIAHSTAHNHRLLTGEPPKVAFLSFSTRESAEHPRVAKVREAAELFRRTYPEIVSDGELQFDAAYVPAVAERKTPDGPLQGRANVFVFPDLDAGNIAYKITERLAGFSAYGPLLQGLARPFLDLSRGCTAEDIATVAAIAAVMSE